MVAAAQVSPLDQTNDAWTSGSHHIHYLRRSEIELQLEFYGGTPPSDRENDQTSELVVAEFRQLQDCPLLHSGAHCLDMAAYVS